MDEFNQQKPTLIKPLFLTGMMGCGKTYLGKIIARDLDIPFYDTDAVIEERAGCSVSEIFSRDGEEKFRESEKKVIADLLAAGPAIIATGGGAVTTPETLSAMKEYGVMVWLRAPIKTLLERTSRSANRPLLEKGDPAEIMEALLSAREPLYSQAHITLETEEIEGPPASARTIKTLYEQLNDGNFSAS